MARRLGMIVTMTLALACQRVDYYDTGGDTGGAGSGTSAATGPATAADDGGDSTDTGAPKLDIPDDPKYCDVADDCVAVSCSCYCSGCNGFPWEDVVNEAYYDAWYEEQGCEWPQYCTTGCCPSAEIACVDNQCAVIKP